MGDDGRDDDMVDWMDDDMVDCERDKEMRW